MMVAPALTKLGDYQLLRLLGSGGMGDVYFGVSPTADRVAVKVIRSHLLDDPKIRERFAAEVESLQLIWGSRVARLESADTAGDPAWLAVEYIPGPTVVQHVEARGSLPTQLGAMVGAMLADGLDKVHQAGLLHRDVKPHNIILGPRGPVLIDFGLAVLAERDNYLTEPGNLVGTPAYMSPERINGERSLTPAADTYGLAATLVFALTGHTLYHSNGLHGLLLQIGDADVLPDLSGVPVELAPLIGAMLAFDPTARPSLADVRARLLEVATSGGVPTQALHRQVSALTYDSAADFRLPPELTDPVRDPEGDEADDEDRAEPSVNPPVAVSTLDTDKPPNPPQADVGWLVDKLRHQYSRRPTLGPSRSS